MAEYIEREMSLKTIDEYFHMTNPDGEEQIGALKSRKIIRTLPAADVAPVRHGKWLKGGYACGETEFQCSACGETEWRTSIDRIKYCPFCGAMMEGGSDG